MNNTNNPYQSPVSAAALPTAEQQKSTWIIAPAWRRIVAFFVNRLLMWLLPSLPLIIYYVSGHDLVRMEEDPIVANIMRLCGVLLAVLLIIQTWMMSRYGQSIGKKLMGIRVLHQSGDAAGFFRVVLLRYLVPMLIFVFLSFMLSFLSKYFYVLWCGVIALGLRRSVEDKRQTWQDVMASTMVVQVVKKTDFVNHYQSDSVDE